MKKNKIGSSLIEALVVIAILSIGIVGVYAFFSNSRNFLDGVSSKIEAIEIAREGIEAVENIRNTNWFRFGTDLDNCWNVLNYDKNCISGSSGFSTVKKMGGGKTYILKNENGLWKLEEEAPPSGKFGDNLSNYGVGKNKIDFKYCQPINESGDCITKFSNGNTLIGKYTRIIKIENFSFDASLRNAEKLKVTSLVEWTDSSKEGTRQVEFVNLMTNYKK